MPAEGVRKKNHSDVMSEEEMISVVEAVAELCIRKICFTGGETLIKKSIISLRRRTHKIPGINEIRITTNGILLPPLAESFKASGIARNNVSLDTLSGIDAAVKAGFMEKINTVLINGFNDYEISDFAAITLRRDVDVRFIELMPMVESFSGFLAANKLHDSLPDIEPLESDGSAKIYRLKNAQERIGIISPVSKPFCDSC